MATTKFRLSSKTDKVTGKAEVLVRFYHGRIIDQYTRTNIFVPADAWNDKAERLTIPKPRVMTAEAKATISELAALNAELEALKMHIEESFLGAGAGKVAFADTWLEDLVHRYNFPTEDGLPHAILDAMGRFIELREASPARKSHYKTVMRALTRFFTYQGLGEDIEFDAITPETIHDFLSYLQAEHTFYHIEKDREGNAIVCFDDADFEKAFKVASETRMPEPRGRNTLNKFLHTFRTLFLWAIDNDLATKNPFRKVKIPASKYGTPYYITIAERNQLQAYDLSSRPSLEVQRDIFVFQCVIGCRVSDLRRLTKASIVDGAVEYIPKKTKGEKPLVVRVPLNAIAKGIIEKYQDTPGDRLLPCISDQKYNDAIKEIFTIAGLTRPVTILNPVTGEDEKRPLNEVASSHLARRCFIGNLYKQVKDPNLIGKLSGHAEGSKAFARYRDIDEDMRKELVTLLV